MLLLHVCIMRRSLKNSYSWHGTFLSWGILWISWQKYITVFFKELTTVFKISAKMQNTKKYWEYNCFVYKVEQKCKSCSCPPFYALHCSDSHWASLHQNLFYGKSNSVANKVESSSLCSALLYCCGQSLCYNIVRCQPLEYWRPQWKKSAVVFAISNLIEVGPTT